MLYLVGYYRRKLSPKEESLSYKDKLYMSNLLVLDHLIIYMRSLLRHLGLLIMDEDGLLFSA